MAWLIRSVRPQLSMRKPRSRLNLSNAEFESKRLKELKQHSGLGKQMTWLFIWWREKKNIYRTMKNVSYLSCLGSQSSPGRSRRAVCLTSSLSTKRLRRCSAWTIETRIHSIRGGSKGKGLYEEQILLLNQLCIPNSTPLPAGSSHLKYLKPKWHDVTVKKLLWLCISSKIYSFLSLKANQKSSYCICGYCTALKLNISHFTC